LAWEGTFFTQSLLEMDTSTIFTKTSAYSLGGVVVVGLIAYIGSKIFLPKNARWQDRYTFVWLVNFLGLFFIVSFSHFSSGF
jgi:hypothetical protein